MTRIYKFFLPTALIILGLTLPSLGYAQTWWWGKEKTNEDVPIYNTLEQSKKSGLPYSSQLTKSTGGIVARYNPSDLMSEQEIQMNMANIQNSVNRASQTRNQIMREEYNRELMQKRQEAIAKAKAEQPTQESTSPKVYVLPEPTGIKKPRKVFNSVSP